MTKQLQLKLNIQDIDKNLLNKMNENYEKQINELRFLADKRFTELEKSMQSQYDDRVFFILIFVK